ncbi:MAG: hypothetical protein K8L97_07725 [Anaerolineae bacterium]|nr:hypothetical protein [Anaerolineae bacterium]
MEAKVFEIKEYMVVWRQLELMNVNGITARVRALVRCTGGEYTLDVYFLAEDSAYPEPTYDVPNKRGYMYLNIRDIGPFVDMLRNEKPVYGHLRGDRPEWMSVTTGKEPVGEGEL